MKYEKTAQREVSILKTEGMEGTGFPENKPPKPPRVTAPPHQLAHRRWADQRGHHSGCVVGEAATEGMESNDSRDEQGGQEDEGGYRRSIFLPCHGGPSAGGIP